MSYVPTINPGPSIKFAKRHNGPLDIQDLLDKGLVHKVQTEGRMSVTHDGDESRTHFLGVIWGLTLADALPDLIRELGGKAFAVVEDDAPDEEAFALLGFKLLKTRREPTPEEKMLWNKLDLHVSTLGLNQKTANLLGNMLVGELVQETEASLLRWPNFGRKSLNGIKVVFDALDLSLGMTTDQLMGWEPPHVRTDAHT